MSIKRLLAFSSLGVLMSLPAFASSLTYSNIVYNSDSLCAGVCTYGTTFGWAAVNDNNVVATSFAVAGTNYFGFTYSGGVYSSPIQDGVKPTSFAGINNAGEMSGFYSPTGSFSGFTDNGGTFSSALNMPSSTTFTNGTPNPFTSGVVTATFMNGLEANGGTASPSVGFFSTSGLSGQTKGFVYNPANSTAFSPLECTSTATTTNPYSINDSGEVVGYCKTSSGGLQQGFVYNDATPTTAPTILNSSALATAIGDTVSGVFLTAVDDSGDLAGYYSGGANLQFNGFYCKGSYTFTNCSVIDVPQVDAFNTSATINGTQILSINNEGSIAGIYTESSGATYVFLATTNTAPSVPEPGTLMLTGIAILGVVGFRFRRKLTTR